MDQGKNEFGQYLKEFLGSHNLIPLNGYFGRYSARYTYQLGNKASNIDYIIVDPTLFSRCTSFAINDSIIGINHFPIVGTFVIDMKLSDVPIQNVLLFTNSK